MQGGVGREFGDEQGGGRNQAVTGRQVRAEPAFGGTAHGVRTARGGGEERAEARRPRGRPGAVDSGSGFLVHLTESDVMDLL
ncbi:hypothetical protein [Streptomyces abyssomicinicus]|uniref:hypothetical protein n=1 Tax=Streptomyces abyssomicinicus TaxID=574929 RepID=UPI001FECCD2C|nr:hypothetical protein [Streptomyces abyssomicinicus]